MILDDYEIQWEYIDHSIMIIGWGEDPITAEKFWICTNSYGTKYGEGRGHFRVRRGANDFGIESEPTAFEPTVLI